MAEEREGGRIRRGRVPGNRNRRGVGGRKQVEDEREGEERGGGQEDCESKSKGKEAMRGGEREEKKEKKG